MMTWAKGVLKNIEKYRNQFPNEIEQSSSLWYRSKMPTWGKLVYQKNCKKNADVLYGWSLTLVDS